MWIQGEINMHKFKGWLVQIGTKMMHEQTKGKPTSTWKGVTTLFIIIYFVIIGRLHQNDKKIRSQIYFTLSNYELCNFASS
jgi:hypothetical protein